MLQGKVGNQRLCLEGGIDCNEVFSPVVKHSSIHILLSLVTQYDFELDQLDVKITFLHGDPT